jgi:hypothetical protein
MISRRVSGQGGGAARIDRVRTALSTLVAKAKDISRRRGREAQPGLSSSLLEL